MLNVTRLLIVGSAIGLTACNAKMGKKGQPNPTPPPIEQQRSPYYPPGTYTQYPPSVYSPNAPAVAPVSPITPIATDSPNVYQPHVALDGMGEWVVIDGQRFWVPNLSQVQDREGWAPYQQGFWSYDQDRDWTWNSQEPWGAITDHYGIWRHHRTRGWIWMAFPDNRYEPHCVTWFDEDKHVGWYPYMPGFEAHYRRFGASHGFDDGFWEGHRAVFSLRANVFGFRLGITMVERAHITERNIRRRMIRDHGLIVRIAQMGHSDLHFRAGRVGRIPGGNRSQSHDFLQRWAPHQRAPVGRTREVTWRGNTRIMHPHFDQNGDGRPDGRRDVRSDDRRDGDRRGNDRRDDRRTDRRSTPVTVAPAAPAAAPSAPAAAQPRTNPPRTQQPQRDGDRQTDRRGNRREGDRRVDIRPDTATTGTAADTSASN